MIASTFDGDTFEQAAHGLVDAAVAGADTSELAVLIERRIVCGAAGPTILEIAAEGSVIVVGSRGRGGSRDCCWDRSAIT